MNVDAEAMAAVVLHASGLSSFFYCVEAMDSAAHLTMVAVDAAVAMITIIAAASGLSFFFSSAAATAASLAIMVVAATTTAAVDANRQKRFPLKNQMSKRQ